MNKILPLFAFSILIFVPIGIQNAYAATFFVAVSGDDSNDGMSMAFPFQTISAAFDVAVSGDIIVVQPGTYFGDLVISEELTFSIDQCSSEEDLRDADMDGTPNCLDVDTNQPQVIKPGFDLLDVNPTGITEIALSIPAGHFGDIGGVPSDPFTGIIPLRGELPPTGTFQRSPFQLSPFQLLDTANPGSKFALKEHPRTSPQGTAPVVIERLDEIVLSNIGDTATVDVEMVSLSLTSINPIQVTYGSVGDQFFDVFVELEPNPTPTGHRGFYIIDRSIPTGGTVQQITFTGLELQLRFENPNAPQAEYVPYLGDVILEIPVEYNLISLIGGNIIPIEATSLILAGVQTPAVWMLSALSALGIGAFWITRNPYNVRNIKVLLEDYFDRIK